MLFILPESKCKQTTRFPPRYSKTNHELSFFHLKLTTRDITRTIGVNATSIVVVVFILGFCFGMISFGIELYTIIKMKLVPTVLTGKKDDSSGELDILLLKPLYRRLSLRTYKFSREFSYGREKEHTTAYLPGAGLTVIIKAVGPGWGFSIALRKSWRLR